MWKRAGLAVAGAVAIVGMSSPAFACPPGGGWGENHHHHGHGEQIGLINIGDVDVLHNVSGVLGLCGNDAAVLGGVVPIGSPNPSENCALGGIGTGNEHN